jgi:hypothetical protein
VIVRISNEGQFRLDDGLHARLDELDASDVILPPPDLSFVEAGEEFTGDGLIPEPA